MKVLLVNRYLYRRGGDATYTIALARLLQQKGIDVVCFGLQAPENDPALRIPVTIPPIDFPVLMERSGLSSVFKVLCRTIYSREARARMEEVLDAERPDIVHLQNIHHHLSPSVIAAAAGRKVPVVWTLHDYSVICPNGNLFSRGRTCEECRPARFRRMIVKRCKRNSLPASLVAATESAVHRALGVFDRVSLFIAPSRFLAGKLEEFGFHSGKIVHLDNFIEPSPASAPGGSPRRRDGGAGRRALVFTGRLIADKGIATLLQAAERWGDIPLRIAGEGPLSDLVRAASLRCPAIEYLGAIDAARVSTLLTGSLGAVIPSISYENQPFGVLEAFAAGRPVIGASHGGIPELIGDEERGLLVRPGDPEDLVRAVHRLAADHSEADRMGQAGRRFVEERFSPQVHYDGLMRLYHRARNDEVNRAA